METILLKIILCSGIFLGLYYLFLAKEKTLVFNRFYLLFSLLFSVAIPFLSIKKETTEVPNSVLVFQQQMPEHNITEIPAEQGGFNYSYIIGSVYSVIMLVLVLKLFLSIIKIKKLRGRKIIYKNRETVLLYQDLAPFSFWNTIYLSEKYFRNNQIENSIFLHEEIHIRQKHSLDVIFSEFMKAILWFNPFVYLYHKAIVNNHEFIADEEVLHKNNNVKQYQELILSEILKQQNLSLIHQFNFNNTKKRFIMMTKKNSKFSNAKKMMMIPFFVISGYAFSEKVYNVTTDNKASEIKFSKKATVNNSIEEKPTTNVEALPKSAKQDTIPIKKNIEAKENRQNVANGEPSEMIPAEYPGGSVKLRNLINSYFNISEIKEDVGILKTVIYFTVDDQGKVNNYNVKGENASFNNEALRVAKLACENVTWKPALLNGKPVSFQYKMPITIAFAEEKKQK